MKRKRRSSADGQPLDLVAVAERGILAEVLEHYITECLRRDGEEGRKRRIVPNLAGFCRFCGIGREQVEHLRQELPSQYDALISVFEDEALNSEMSASVLAYYMKNLLGVEGEQETAAEPVIRFEHDIMRDGE